jgi:hypothetical protein
MNYLTNFYKNRCEVLNEQIFILKKQISFLSEAGDPKDERSAPPPPPDRGDDRGGDSGAIGGGRGQGGGGAGGGGGGPVLDYVDREAFPGMNPAIFENLAKIQYWLDLLENGTPEQQTAAMGWLRKLLKKTEALTPEQEAAADAVRRMSRTRILTPEQQAARARRYLELYAQVHNGESLSDALKRLRSGDYSTPRTVIDPGPPERKITLDVMHPNYDAGQTPTPSDPGLRPPNCPGGTTPATWVPSETNPPGWWTQDGTSPIGGNDKGAWIFTPGPNGQGGGWMWSSSSDAGDFAS